MAADTIFALSTGRPPAAVAVIRVSGPLAHKAGERIAGDLPAVREAGLRALRNPADGLVLDHAIVLRFDGPASATGEDVVEFQTHGGRAVADAVLGALTSIDGLRAARPGEFTRRAFENGRIDLTEAEGLADLLEAETETQRRAALALAEGGLRRQIEQWQDRLVALSARAEAAIDYVGDDGLDEDPTLAADCAALAAELRQWLGRPRVEPLRDGVRIVLAGPPNSGKSSLLNVLAGSERAIVTAIPGTTRDHIEVPLSLAGFPVVVTDTAGLRESDDPVERIGVERARSAADRADILVWMGDSAGIPDHPRSVAVHARCDLAGREVAPSGSIAVSATEGTGISELLERLKAMSLKLVPGDDALALNRRQALHLEEAAGSIDDASCPDLLIAAESLRAARGEMDRLTGRAGIEEVLDAVFSRFCLGK